MQQPETDHRNGTAPDVLPLPAPPEAVGEPPQQGHAGSAIAPAVYTADELARLLAVSRRAIERWQAAGKLPHGARLQLPGRIVRYRKDVIDRWLSEGCPPPAKVRRPR